MSFIYIITTQPYGDKVLTASQAYYVYPDKEGAKEMAAYRAQDSGTAWYVYELTAPTPIFSYKAFSKVEEIDLSDQG